MSLTALVGLALGTAAMTVVLSAFAGLEDLVADQFEDANPPLKISPTGGTSLVLSAEDTAYLIQQRPVIQRQYLNPFTSNAFYLLKARINTLHMYWVSLMNIFGSTV